MQQSILAPERVMALLDYDPASGHFRWRVSRGRAAAGQRADRSTKSGYMVVKLDGRHWQAHRLAWVYMIGSWPTGEIDHINSVRSDNRIENLRDVSKVINQQNRHRARIDNKTGLQGVFKHKDCERWVAQIQANGVQRYLGLYRSPEAAHEAYLAAKRALHEQAISGRDLPDSYPRCNPS